MVKKFCLGEKKIDNKPRPFKFNIKVSYSNEKNDLNFHALHFSFELVINF